MNVIFVEKSTGKEIPANMFFVGRKITDFETANAQSIQDAILEDYDIKITK